MIALAPVAEERPPVHDAAGARHAPTGGGLAGVPCQGEIGSGKRSAIHAAPRRHVGCGDFRQADLSRMLLGARASQQRSPIAR